MAGKGDGFRKVVRKKYDKGITGAFGHWSCSKCWKTNNQKTARKCGQCGAKKPGNYDT